MIDINLITLLSLSQVEKKPKPFMTGTAGWHRKMLGLNAPSILAKAMLGFFSDVDTHIQLLRYFFQNAAFPEKLKGF